MAFARIKECHNCGSIMADLTISPKRDRPYEFRCRNCDAEAIQPRHDSNNRIVHREFLQEPDTIFKGIPLDATCEEFIGHEDVEVRVDVYDT